MNLKAKAKQLKIDIPALYLALHKKETPFIAKVFAGVSVAYALSPIDLIPDFIPVLGYLDDVILLPCMVAISVKLIPSDIFVECRKEAETLWSEGRPKHYIYAVPIILLWLLIIVFIIKKIR